MAVWSNPFDDILLPMPQCDMRAYYQKEATNNFSGAKRRLDYLINLPDKADNAARPAAGDERVISTRRKQS
jgi:hypothetical protein